MPPNPTEPYVKLGLGFTKLLKTWWAQQDSNLRLPPCEKSNPKQYKHLQGLSRHISPCKPYNTQNYVPFLCPRTGVLCPSRFEPMTSSMPYPISQIYLRHPHLCTLPWRAARA